MKISELSAATDVPIGTIKYYLREGLLPPVERTSRTTAKYHDGHVARVRLVRALTEAGGLGITQVKRVVAVIDADDPLHLDVLATAQDALVEGAAADEGGVHAEGVGAHTEGLGLPADEPDHPGTCSGPGRAETAPVRTRAQAWAERRGWFSYDGDQVIERLERAWQACEEADIEVDETMMGQYADAVEGIARVDVGSVSPEADDAVRRVIVGTVMIEPVLAALRLLAQRQIAMTERDTRS